MLSRVFGEGLPHKVSVYVPSTTDVRESLDSEAANKVVDSVRRYLANLFGGATAVSAEGSWVAQDGTLVTEKVTIVYAFTPQLTRAQLLDIKRYATQLKRELGQEAIAVEIDSKLFFV